jgi:hypothetical protein
MKRRPTFHAPRIAMQGNLNQAAADLAASRRSLRRAGERRDLMTAS